MTTRVVQARAIGVMTMLDAGKRDHKVLAVAVDDPEYNGFHWNRQHGFTSQSWMQGVSGTSPRRDNEYDGVANF